MMADQDTSKFNGASTRNSAILYSRPVSLEKHGNGEAQQDRHLDLAD
jgi:hypothetical protein